MDLEETEGACAGDSWWSGARDGERAREEEEELRWSRQYTSVFSLDKNQCYKSNAVSSLYT